MVPGVWKEPPGYGVRRKLMRSGALEAHHTLRLLVAVGDVVGVVTHVLLSSVGETLVARGLVGHTMGTLRQDVTIVLHSIDSHIGEADLNASNTNTFPIWV